MAGIIVAGGAGFIGSNLCQKLLDQNFNVICVDNLLTGNKNNIEEFLKNPNFKFIEKDITQTDLESEIKEKIDFIFHLASPASPNKRSEKSYINYPIETLLVNSLGTYNLLEFSKRHGSRFLFASSSEIYGDPAVSPQPENYFGNVNPVGVRSVYDEGKRFGESISIAYARKFNVDTRVVRIFNTFGPKMRIDDGRVISNFITQAISKKPITVYGEGQQTRSFCYVSDMVNALVKAMFSDKVKGEAVNIGNPDERKIIDMANIIKEMTVSGSKIVHEELPEDDPKSRKPDIKKAETLLSWKPEVNLEQGLKKTIEYFKTIAIE